MQPIYSAVQIYHQAYIIVLIFQLQENTTSTAQHTTAVSDGGPVSKQPSSFLSNHSILMRYYYQQTTPPPSVASKPTHRPTCTPGTDEGYLFDATTHEWQSRCAVDGACFRPKVLQNPRTGEYVL